MLCEPGENIADLATAAAFPLPRTPSRLPGTPGSPGRTGLRRRIPDRALSAAYASAINGTGTEPAVPMRPFPGFLPVARETVHKNVPAEFPRLEFEARRRTADRAVHTTVHTAEGRAADRAVEAAGGRIPVPAQRRTPARARGRMG